MTKKDFYEEHEATADRILSCNSWDFAHILSLKEPITKEGARVAFESFSSLLVPECNPGPQYKRAQEAHDCKHYLYISGLSDAFYDSGLYKAARHYGVDIKEYFGNNYAPPLLSEEYGSRSTMRGNVNPCYHCDQPKSHPYSSEVKNYYFQTMICIIDRVLQCDPNDFRRILDLKDGYDQNDLDDQFWRISTWVSPFITPYWEAGEFSERQKKAFKSGLARVTF